jgi:hypothetical protein
MPPRHTPTAQSSPVRHLGVRRRQPQIQWKLLKSGHLHWPQRVCWAAMPGIRAAASTWALILIFLRGAKLRKAKLESSEPRITGAWVGGKLRPKKGKAQMPFVIICTFTPTAYSYCGVLIPMLSVSKSKPGAPNYDHGPSAVDVPQDSQ